ncbi:MAG: SURF1 family protein [Gemmatimonadota bacterium]
MSPRARISLAIFLLLGAALCVRLGFWQLSRLDQRKAMNARAAAQRTAPEQPILAVTGNRDNRRVRATGTFDRAYEVVLRGQVHDGSPGVHVVTPLRLAGSDSAVLVNRGFVPAADAMTANLDALGEPGPVTVTGIALSIGATRDGGQPLERNGATTWRQLDLEALRQRTPYPLLDVVIIREPGPDSSAFPRPVPPPDLSNGPHLNYAIQWFAFATIAVVGGVILLRKKRERAAP